MNETLEMEDKKDRKYPWHLLRRTALLLNAYLVCGLSIGVVGPTLLDLKDMVGATLGQISFILMMNSIGSLVGCFFTGFLLDRLLQHKFLILGGTLTLLSFPLAAYPFCSSLISLYVCSFLAGVGGGSLDNAVNVLVLSIWEGRNSGPYMHALHFTWGLGAFLAPLTAKPFLVNQEDSRNETTLAEGNMNGTSVDNPFLTIKTLYPSLSSYGLFTTIGCLIYFLKDLGQSTQTEDKREKLEEEKSGNISVKFKLMIIGLLTLIFFLYNGMEVAFGTFISVFAVKSGQRLTRGEASEVTALFWGTFATMRALSVLLAVVARPATVMWASVSVCFAGSVVLSVWADDSYPVLCLGTAMLGLGMASIIATGFLWTEERIRVTSKAGRY